MQNDILIRDYIPGEPSYVCYMQMRLYAEQYGFNGAFERCLAQSLVGFVEDPSKSHLWIAEKEHRIVGSIAVVESDTQPPLIKWFAVSPELQGMGIGGRLIDTAIGFCVARGYTHMYLWTIEILKSARHIYKKHGFAISETRENKLWTKDALTEEKWEYYSPC